MMEYLVILLLFVNALANEDKTLGMGEVNPASSCIVIRYTSIILLHCSRRTIGQYWINTNEGLFKVTCNMKLKYGGVEGGWIQVVDVDMNGDDSCPGTWHKITTPRRLCLGYIAGCASAHFYVRGVSFENICGQAKGYQKGGIDAFFFKRKAIDESYRDVGSITVGWCWLYYW